MSDLCAITPISAFLSTNLNSKIECYQALGQRIMRILGHPIINVEIHPDQLYDSISMACEFYTKYAGYTKEYLIFDSRLYELDKGLRLDHLFTVANTGYTLSQKLAESTIPNPDSNIELRENLYISLSNIPQSYFSSASSLSSAVPEDGITMMQVLSESSYTEIINFAPELSSVFHLSPQKTFTVQCEPREDVKRFNNMFDYDIMEYRKVIDVIDFEEGSNGGVTSLFSIESFLQQQTMQSHNMSNFGFDMLSWHMTKDWLNTRSKVFATKKDVHFDNRTQYLRIYPQPKYGSVYHGLLECYVERPLRDIVKEKFVLDYAVALCKISWGRVLTKISGVNLLGGGTLNGGEILQEGVSEKLALEAFLIEGGYGDFDPVMMQLG